MKILIVNTIDTIGGAARAAMRLHKSLLGAGISSTMLVRTKYSSSSDIISLPKGNLYSRIVRKIKLKRSEKRVSVFKIGSKNILFSTADVHSSALVEFINSQKPDLVHLHWINDNFLSIEDLSKIESPIVWSLHDMWPFTGGCHYDEDCGRYSQNCGMCKILRSKDQFDLSFSVFKRKEKSFSRIENLTIVGLSKWLTNCASGSSLFHNCKIVNLPNTIDTQLFKPTDKNTARKIWNFPSHKKLILFGAMNATSDPRKGYIKLYDSFSFLEKNEIELVIFGAEGPKNCTEFPFPVHFVGVLNDEISLATLYSACDVMIVPSIQENLSNSIMESLACGTPVVSFHIGGNSDMIEHKVNGYLATPYEPQSLAEGVNWIFNHTDYKQLSDNARRIAVERFDFSVVSKQYINLYKKILK